MALNLQDKVNILYDRRIKLSIEWGGVINVFSSMSDIDEDLAVVLLLGFKTEMSKVEFEKLISDVVQRQYERE